jgi:hypothetical protein
LGFLALGIEGLAKEFWTKVETEMTLKLAELSPPQRWRLYLPTPPFHSPSVHGTILFFPQEGLKKFLLLLFPLLCISFPVLLVN